MDALTISILIPYVIIGMISMYWVTQDYVDDYYDGRWPIRVALITSVCVIIWPIFWVLIIFLCIVDWVRS